MAAHIEQLPGARARVGLPRGVKAVEGWRDSTESWGWASEEHPFRFAQLRRSRATSLAPELGVVSAHRLRDLCQVAHACGRYDGGDARGCAKVDVASDVLLFSPFAVAWAVAWYASNAVVVNREPLDEHGHRFRHAERVAVCAKLLAHVEQGISLRPSNL